MAAPAILLHVDIALSLYLAAVRPVYYRLLVHPRAPFAGRSWYYRPRHGIGNLAVDQLHPGNHLGRLQRGDDRIDYRDTDLVAHGLADARQECHAHAAEHEDVGSILFDGAAGGFGCFFERSRALLRKIHDREPNPAHRGQQRLEGERAQARRHAAETTPGRSEHGKSRAELGGEVQRRRARADDRNPEHLAQSIDARIAVAADDDGIKAAFLRMRSEPDQLGNHDSGVARAFDRRRAGGCWFDGDGGSRGGVFLQDLLAPTHLLRPDSLVHRTRELIEDPHRRDSSALLNEAWPACRKSGAGNPRVCR